MPDVLLHPLISYVSHGLRDFVTVDAVSHSLDGKFSSSMLFLVSFTIAIGSNRYVRRRRCVSVARLDSISTRILELPSYGLARSLTRCARPQEGEQGRGRASGSEREASGEQFHPERAPVEQHLRG